MNDREYEAQKKRVKAVVDKWHDAMGLGWFSIDMHWSRTPDEENPDNAAVVSTHWQYRNAAITWYLPVIESVSDDKLENIVIHEFVHILINPLTLVEKSEDLAMQHEYATECIARAFEWVRKAGQDDAKKAMKKA